MDKEVLVFEDGKTEDQTREHVKPTNEFKKITGNPILNNATEIHPSTSVGWGRQRLSQLHLLGHSTS
jgi:hypothetical protein